MKKINLSHNWSINGQEKKNFSIPFCFKGEGGLASIRLPNFSYPAFLELNGLPYLTDLYVDGKYVKTIQYVRELIRLDGFGSGGELTLKFAKDIAINRNVNLYASTDSLYIIPYGLDIKFNKESKDGASISVKAELVNENKKRRVAVNFFVYKNANKRIARKKKYITFDKGQKTVEANLNIKKYIKYGYPDNKEYRLVALIEEKGEFLDSCETMFGIIEDYDCKEKLLGTIVPDTKGIFGSLSYLDHERRILSGLGDLGYNAIRYKEIPSEESLLAADEIGMKVIVDVLDKWEYPNGYNANHLTFKDNYEQRLKDNIRYLRNHPSVVMYSIGDELEEAYGRSLNSYIENIIDIIKSLSSKCITSAIKELIPTKEEYIKSGIAYPAKNDIMSNSRENKLFDKLTKNFRNKLDVVGYSFPAKEILIRDYSKPSIALAVSQKDFYSASFDMLKCDNAIGVIGCDGMNNVGFGDLDGTCLPTPIGQYKTAYVTKEISNIFTSDKEVELNDYSSSWNYEKDKEINVKVATPGEVVALYLNDRIISRKLAGKPNQNIATFKVPYEEGKLEAICYYKGKEISRAILNTNSKVRGIRLLSGKKTLHLSNNELSFVDVWIVDRKGNVTTDFDDNNVSISVEDGLEIVGAGNANGPSNSNSITIIKGHALVAVKGTKIGKFLINIIGEGLVAGKLLINVKE